MAGAIERRRFLCDDAFKPHRARFGVQLFTARPVEMLRVEDAFRFSFRQEFFEDALALDQRRVAQIPPVHKQTVEGIEGETIMPAGGKIGLQL